MNYKRVLPIKTLKDLPEGVSDSLSPTLRKNQIKRLMNKHREMARMIASGVSNEKVQKKFELSPKRFSQIKNSPLFKEELERQHSMRDAGVARLQERINDHGHEAFEKQLEVMREARSEDVQRKAAEFILEKAVPTVHRSMNINVTVDHPVDLSAYLGQPNAQIEGDVIDIEGGCQK